MLSAWKITAPRRNCSSVNCLRASTPRKTRKLASKVSMNLSGVTPDYLEYPVQDRDKWYEVVEGEAKDCEESKNTATDFRKKLTKGTAMSATVTPISCFHCLELFRAKIGHITDMCTHGSHPQSENWSDGPHRLRWTKNLIYVWTRFGIY